MLRYPLVVGLCLGLTAPALAQKTKSATKHTGKGYTIVVPAGWDAADKSELDEAVAAQFFAKEINNFSDNLNIVELGPVEFTDDLVAALRGELERTYAAQFTNGFKMTDYKKTKIATHDAIYVSGNYTYEGHKLSMIQVFISGEKLAVTLTCTVATGRLAKVSKQCDEAFASLKFE